MGKTRLNVALGLTVAFVTLGLSLLLDVTFVAIVSGMIGAAFPAMLIYGVIQFEADSKAA
ncbi:MAG: hypothetical protein ACI8U4_002973 [Natronomonas sp.]|jgi:hypothetical protein